MRARKPAEASRSGLPLTLYGVAVYRVSKGGDFDLKTWTGHGGVAYALDVENGAIRSTQAGGGIY
jgi:hypothetical protein